ncbi:catecholate siderophore receptor [Formivibrio citricus]|uniref:Catecholate siderophore receptor n=1 Tax=Formivibrio citricus TaxID=83765 RepID=A0A1I5CPL7_9NEIS|nr:TonB-dependent siderophore receptor [Formivibrio citricus]SFN88852.1 catecholate siderophore receptor [Formivibrio citricus]
MKPVHTLRSSAPPTRLTTLALLLIGLGCSGNALSAPESTATPASDTVLPATVVEASTEPPPGKETLRATTTSIGKGKQALRDIPQSVTVVTEKLIDDRNLDTMKEALKNTSGVSFQAAEGGEEDIRLRGFSLQSSGDVFIDGMRDPAFYDRDSFNWDRLEVLRGSASMLFGRGSTGGAVNQVTKKPLLNTQHEVSLTAGTGDFFRTTGDFNFKTGESAALRINAMANTADNDGAGIKKGGIAPTFSWGIGTADEFTLGFYYLKNDNGINYGLPWLTPGKSGGNYLWNTDPRNYYGMASDYNVTGTTQYSASHLHRFMNGDELKTQLRIASYQRDQRASAIRFANASLQPDGKTVTSDTFGDSTVLTRGTNIKIMDMDTQYLQSDYSGKFKVQGKEHAVLAGVDMAHESFSNSATSLPSGVTLTKPTTTVGTPDDGASVNESLRIVTENRRFDSRALGIYAQDTIQIAPMWKILGGLRWDLFKGSYENLASTATSNNNCGVAAKAEIGRTDSLLSKRFGVLFQPTSRQSYHLSYGTSFNTSGDAYQYDAGTVKVDPESSRNIELGAKLDSSDGRFTTRLALFHATKYNERNRDSDTVNACNYVLSGERHAAGAEIDLAGRLTPAWEVFASYAYIPVARVDSSTGATGTEAVGSRPGLTPRHSGTFWTTYKLTSELRIGGGINFRSRDTPAGSTIQAPAYVTGDLMAEYDLGSHAYKLNITNITNEHYADYLYRGHYVAGKARAAQLTVSFRF